MNSELCRTQDGVEYRDLNKNGSMDPEDRNYESDEELVKRDFYLSRDRYNVQYWKCALIIKT
jgi:hypothetical protein